MEVNYTSISVLFFVYKLTCISIVDFCICMNSRVLKQLYLIALIDWGYSIIIIVIMITIIIVLLLLLLLLLLLY